MEDAMLKIGTIGASLGALMMTAAAPAKTHKEANAEAIAAAKPDGKPESCIPIRSIRETRVRSDSIIDFFTYGKKVYRVTLPQSCPRLGFEEAFSYSTSLSQLCSTDIITVLNRSGGGINGPSCGMGEFQPVTGLGR